MTPEEKFSLQIWEILQNIQEEILATENAKPVKYRIPSVTGVGIIPKDRRIKILYKLQEEDAFQIQKNSEGTRIGTGDIFYLIINPSNFKSIYDKYRKACDLQSHLNDFQEKAYSNLSANKNIDDDVPKFLNIEKEGEEPVFRKDISQIATYSTEAKNIADQFSPENRQFVIKVLQKIIPLADFSVDGKIYYYLQSPSGHPDLINERLLLKKFDQQGLFRNLGEDDIYGITTLSRLNTKLIRDVIERLKERNSGITNSEEFHKLKKEIRDFVAETTKSPTKPEIKYKRIINDIRSKQQSSDLSKRYDTLIKEIKSSRSSPNLEGEYTQQNSNKTINKTSEVDLPAVSNNTPPLNWELTSQDGLPEIRQDKLVVFVFPNNWSNKYKYFKCLWQNYGTQKSCKEVYEFESGQKHPEKNVWRINRNIRNTINKLRQEFKNKKLPITIETNKGFTLTIQNP